MIKSLFRVALRNLQKDKWFSLLNIIGLTIGITFSLFLFFYIKDELGFDRYHKNADRIFRIISHIQEPEKRMDWASTQYPLGPTLKKDYPEVEEAVRLVNKERTLFNNGNADNSYYENKIYYADSTFFKIFTHRFIEGNAASALIAPNSIVISKSLAEKYFGKNIPVVGKSLQTVYKDIFQITGVIEDVPKNSHILFDMLISGSTLPKDYQNNWGGFNNFTYVLLKPNTSAAAFMTKLLPLYDKFMAPIFAQYNIKIDYGVQPITDIHLHSKLQGEPEELGSMSYIWIFSSVAFFMLLIACINYMNLTTARSARRAKEIGIRKVSGSTKKQLVLQFLSESILTASISLVLSLGLVIILLHAFNSISGKSFTIFTLLQPFNILLILAIVIFTGFVGGSYPALYLSSFKPVTILKGALSKASGNINLRRTLVVLQFSISMIMLICTWVVYNQLSFLHNADLGFSKAQVMTVTVNTGQDEKNKINSLNNEFHNIPGVKDVGTGYSYPGSSNINLNLFSVESKNGKIDKGINCYAIDEKYINTLGIKIVNGRNFSGRADTLHSILVNEAMVKDFAWENPLGKRVTFPGDTSGNYLEVVGVVKDFHQKSLYNPIEPLILFCSPNCNIIQLKLDAGNIEPLIGRIETTWKKFFPQLPFEYKFLDQDFDSQYTADKKRGKIFAAFSLLTILITFLGLMGLTAFTTQQKQKEISIRRVLGASTSNIVTLITQNYLWLALIATLIAFPIAFYFMNNWLNIFPFHDKLSFFPFLISTLIILCTATLTSIFYSAKAAWANPSNNLRTE